MSKSGLSMALKGIDQAKARISTSKKEIATVIKRTTSDFKSRAPAWVSKAVTGTYGIASKEVKASSSKKVVGSVKIKGELVDNTALVYTGRVLTPTHFKMKPMARPRGTKDDTGRTTRKARPYEVSAEIYKGKRKSLGPSVFLGAGGGGDIPFQRKGSGRLPIIAVRTLSVPQMIGNEQVTKEIQQNIDEGMRKRLDNAVKQIIAKR